MKKATLRFELGWSSDNNRSRVKGLGFVSTMVTIRANESFGANLKIC